MTKNDQGVVKIHSIYVRYLLPMTCELQYWEFTGAEQPVALVFLRHYG